MSSIDDQTAGRIGTNPIYSEFSGSAERHRENLFSKFQFLKELLTVKRVKGVVKGGSPNSKNFFSVKNTHVDDTWTDRPGSAGSFR